MISLQQLAIFVAGLKFRTDEPTQGWLTTTLDLVIICIWISNIVAAAAYMKKKRLSTFGVLSLVANGVGLAIGVYALIALNDVSFQFGELMFGCLIRYAHETYLTVENEFLPITAAAGGQLSPASTLVAVASTTPDSKVVTDRIQQAISAAIHEASSSVGGVLDVDSSYVPFLKHGKHVFDTKIYRFKECSASDATASSTLDGSDDAVLPPLPPPAGDADTSAAVFMYELISIVATRG